MSSPMVAESSAVTETVRDNSKEETPVRTSAVDRRGRQWGEACNPAFRYIRYNLALDSKALDGKMPSPHYPKQFQCSGYTHGKPAFRYIRYKLALDPKASCHHPITRNSFSVQVTTVSNPQQHGHHTCRDLKRVNGMHLSNLNSIPHLHSALRTPPYTQTVPSTLFIYPCEHPMDGRSGGGRNTSKSVWRSLWRRRNMTSWF
eukprot:1194483-Prorocentrum_minimum.AAC.6